MRERWVLAAVEVAAADQARSRYGTCGVAGTGLRAVTNAGLRTCRGWTTALVSWQID
jgi:hypothetical protein